MPRCLALFSGGLDSALAVKLMQNQNIDVIALNFVSNFFGGPADNIQKMADQLQVPVVFVPFHEQQLKVTVDPVYGRGSCFNACIDCHATMLKIAGQLLKRYNADFIVTGEVLGQRPMSQRREALNQVEKLSEQVGLILRPLSAKFLKETIAEKNGLVDRNLLQDIQGRSVGRQTQLAKEFGIVTYPSHGGGCLLTDLSWASRMKTLNSDNMLTGQNHGFLFPVMKNARFLRLDKGKYVFVGRNDPENQVLKLYKQFGVCIQPTLKPGAVPGPFILLFEIGETSPYQYKVQQTSTDLEELKPGKCEFCSEYANFTTEQISGKCAVSDDLKQFGIRLFSHYCKTKGKDEVECLCDDQFVISPKSDDALVKLIEDKLVR